MPLKSAVASTMLKLCHINIRSLPKHFAELCSCSDLISNDILCFSETWLNKSHLDVNYILPNFNLLRRDRDNYNKSKGGGVAFLIKNSVNFEKIDIPV